MNLFSKILIAVSAALFPLVAFAAADTNISSVVIDEEGLEAGDTVAFDVTFTPSTLLTNETISVYFQEVNANNPLNSGFDFSEASYFSGSDALENGTGSTIFNGIGYSIEMATDVELLAAESTIMFDDVQLTDTEGCYRVYVTTEAAGENTSATGSNTFSIGEGYCDLENVETDTYGINAVISWDAFDGASSYNVYYSTSIADFEDEVADSVEVEGTSTTIGSLAPQTEYYFMIGVIDDNGVELFQAGEYTATTYKKRSTRKMAKPTVNEDTLKKRKATVTINKQGDEEYVTKYIIQLRTRKGKKINTFKNVSRDATTKLITRTHLRQGRRYKVRVRAVYFDGVKTRFSRYTPFMTKGIWPTT